MGNELKSEATSNFAKWAKSYSGFEGGNINADIFICGVEWGTNRSDVHFSKTDLEPVKDFPSYNPARAMTGPYNHYVSKILNHLGGADKNMYEPSSKTAKLNLYPIPFKKDEDGLWNIDMFEATGFVLKEQYRVWCQYERFPMLRKIVEGSKAKSKIVLCGGPKSYHDDFIMAFGSMDDLFAGNDHTATFGNNKTCEVYDEDDYLFIYIPLDGAVLFSDDDLRSLANVINREAFIRTIRRASLSELEGIIEEHKSSINEKGANGISPLMFAAKLARRPEVIESLIAAKAKVNDTDDKGKTALIWASAYNQNVDIIDALLNAKADLTAKDKRGRTSLMWAAKNNPNPDIADFLISKGALMEEKSGSGLTPLMYAARDNKNLDVLKLFVAKGAKIDGKSKEGLTTLMLAAKGNYNPDIIDFLISKGASVTAVDNNGLTPLMWAAKNPLNPAIVNCLIKNKAEVNDKSKDGMTPLLFAAKSNMDSEVIDILVKNGAVIDEPYEQDGATPLMLAAAYNLNPDVITTIINYGADMNAKDLKGKTVLDYAKRNPNPEVLELFS